jgi:hypothetical protein
MPSNKDQKRKAIQKCCEALKQLLVSLEATTSILPHLQDVGQINEAAKNGPDDKLKELAQQLRALLRKLKTIPAGDGDAILSANRHEKFFRTGTCQL